MSHQHSHQSSRVLAAVCTQDRRQWTFALQEACDDVYCSPFDLDAQARLRDLLQRGLSISENGVRPDIRTIHAANATATREWVRSVRIACDELHDGPEDVDAQSRLLALLTEFARPA